MKSSKYTLLNKTEVFEQEDDKEYNAPNRSFLKESEVPYSILKDNIQQKRQIQKSSKVSPSTSYQGSNIASKSSQIKQYSQNPPMMATTYHIPNPKNSVIHINSSGIAVQPKVPYIPPVIVECTKCQTKQQIPGNAPEFICCRCHEHNQTQPKFGLFLCGACRSHVSYPFKTSQHIQCNYCFTVNKVPFAPYTSSKVVLPKENIESEPILPKDLREDLNIEQIELADVTTARSDQIQQRQEL